jgi:HSP20 family protein
MTLNRYNHPLFGHNHPLFGFDEFHFNRDPFFSDPMMPVGPNLARPNDMILRHSSPGSEINETDEKYQIAVDVPGVKSSYVNLENDGKVLHITGGRKIVKEGEMSETKFEKRFTIGNNIDIDKMTANLSDGVLMLTAPKKKEEEKPVHAIAITEGPYQEKQKA